MKWLCVIALLLGASSASAEVLTEANMPKFDVAADCASMANDFLNVPKRTNYSDPRADAERADVLANCTKLEETMRKSMLGKDVSPILRQYCEDDTILHSRPGAAYDTFAMCVAKEPGRRNLAKAEAWIGTKYFQYCDLKNDAADQIRAALGRPARDETLECHEREELQHLKYADDPTTIGQPEFNDCLAWMQSKGSAAGSWQVLDACMSDPKTSRVK